MKHCPACNSSFPDFHRVCDFDGIELVRDPLRHSLMRVPVPAARPRRSLASSMLLTSLAVLALFLSAVVVGYLESGTPNIPAVKYQTPSPLTNNSALTLTNTEPPSSAERATARISPKRHSSRLNLSESRAIANGRRDRSNPAEPRTIAKDQRSKSANAARRKDSSDSKLTAMLKTTWNVLKKPFKF